MTTGRINQVSSLFGRRARAREGPLPPPKLQQQKPPPHAAGAGWFERCPLFPPLGASGGVGCPLCRVYALMGPEPHLRGTRDPLERGGCDAVSKSPGVHWVEARPPRSAPFRERGKGMWP